MDRDSPEREGEERTGAGERGDPAPAPPLFRHAAILAGIAAVIVAIYRCVPS